jgi:hypothetical protein
MGKNKKMRLEHFAPQWTYQCREDPFVCVDIWDWTPMRIVHSKQKSTSTLLARRDIPYNVEKLLYKFIIDGVWMYDIMEPTETDAEGNVNNVYYLQRSECSICFSSIQRVNLFKMCCIEPICEECAQIYITEKRAFSLAVPCMEVSCTRSIGEKVLEYIFPGYKQIFPREKGQIFRLDFSSKESRETSFKILFSTRSCKNCHVRIKKTGGCSHMRCTHCGTEQNWVSSRNIFEFFSPRVWGRKD